MRRHHLNLIRRAVPQSIRNSLAPTFHLFEDGYATSRSFFGIKKCPDFLIIGAQKSGTTTLFTTMARHNGLCEPFRKEIGYFDRKFDRHSSNWYFANFPGRMSGLTGEATPDYLFSHQAPKRVKEILPKVRLIAILRDPVSRALSHYYHEVRLGRETLEFDEALERESARLSPGYDASDDSASQMSDLQRRHYFSYIGRGMYGAQIERWLRHFPVDQMHICRFEELKADVTKVANDALAFIGLSANLKSIPRERENVGAYDVSEAKLPEAILGRFDEDQALLQRLVGFTVLND